MTHPTQPLVEPQTGRTVAIDVEMVPVIQGLWALGLWTLECCQGDPAGVHIHPQYGDMARPAVVCFDCNGHMGWWGEPRRHVKGKQHATRLAVMLADVAPDDRWRAWRWDWEYPASAVLLPNEDLPWLVAQLKRLARTEAGQLTLDQRGEAA